ncbi:hypothetical protein FB451DRAFT_292144 [Mycena latifolia]|nr:hypothetical protein FB451DRAFT_292144 [Mycena latifolia]
MRVIRQICIIQFFAWLAWFPVLFYTTMYITDVYLGSFPPSTSNSSSFNSSAAPLQLRLFPFLLLLQLDRGGALRPSPGCPRLRLLELDDQPGRRAHRAEHPAPTGGRGLVDDFT